MATRASMRRRGQSNESSEADDDTTEHTAPLTASTPAGAAARSKKRRKHSKLEATTAGSRVRARAGDDGGERSEPSRRTSPGCRGGADGSDADQDGGEEVECDEAGSLVARWAELLAAPILEPSLLLSPFSAFFGGDQRSGEPKAKRQPTTEPGCEDSWTGYGLGSYDEAPPYLQCNPYVTHGYRVNRAPDASAHNELTIRQCFHSAAFQLSNETGNIWSHGLTGLLTLAAIFGLFLGGAWDGRFFFLVYLAGGLACFTFSTLYHVCNCHSETTWQGMLNLDYTGIGLAYIGAQVLNMYPKFYCFPTIMHNHQIAAASLGFLIIVLLHSKLNAEDNPHAILFRGFMMMTMFLIGVVPSVHHAYLTGSLWVEEKWWYWWKMAVLLVQLMVTGVVYALQAPERFWPGRFNFWLHSHQLMHVSVSLGTAWLLYVNYEYYAWRLENGCAVP